MAGLLTIWLGLRAVVAAGTLPFFILRRERAARGWRSVLFGLALALAGAGLQGFGRPVAYSVFRATASPTTTRTGTATATVTLPPSATLSPTVSRTPTITPTSTITPTPRLPDAVSVLLVHDRVTPHPAAALSPLLIARHLDRSLLPIQPDITFDNPVDILYAAFTYNEFQDGVRWTALWFLGEEIVCLETQPWESGTGGYGYSECLPRGGWRPGAYEVQMFYAERWMVSTRFTVVGPVPTLTAFPAPGAGTP